MYLGSFVQGRGGLIDSGRLGKTSQGAKQYNFRGAVEASTDQQLASQLPTALQLGKTESYMFLCPAQTNA